MTDLKAAVERDPLGTGNDAADIEIAFARIRREGGGLESFLGYLNTRMSLYPWAARNKPRYLAWAIERVGYRLPPAAEG